LTAPRPIDVTRKEARLDTGEMVAVLVPKQKWLFDRLFPEEGAEYTIEPYEPRSTKSHRHYFAVVREAWKNLPEAAGAQHPDAEHLRKFALIKTGWSIKRNVVCESIEQAHAVSALAGSLDESAVVMVQGMVVTIATARSQKTTGPGCMNREEFQKSKQDVLEYCAGLLGVDVSTLSAQVPHSSDADDRHNDDQANHRADTPAAESPGPRTAVQAAGVTLSNWFDWYVERLTRNEPEPLSLLSRHQAAIQDGLGELVKDNKNRQAVCRQAWRLVRDRNEQAITVAEYDLRISKLKSIAMGTRHAA
jgi:hypothetical protein